MRDTSVHASTADQNDQQGLTALTQLGSEARDRHPR